MARGFFLGGFGTGFTSGFKTGSDILARNRALGLEEEGLGLKRRALDIGESQFAETQKLEREKIASTERRDATKALGEDLKQLRDAVKQASLEKGPDVAKRLVNSFASGGQLTVLSMRAQALGAGAITPDGLLTELMNLAEAGQTPEEKGRAAGAEKTATFEAATGAKPTPEQAAQMVGAGAQSEFFQTLQRYAQATDPAEKGLIKQRLDKLTAGQQINVEMDPSGNVRVSIGEGVPGKQMLGAGDIDKLRAELSFTETGLDIAGRLSQAIKQNPAAFGAVGTVRKVKETTVGVLSDVFSAMNIDTRELAKRIDSLIETERKTGGVDAEGAVLLAPPTVGEIDVLESMLTYMVARTLQPEGRLLADTIKTARKSASLTGLTSSAQVAERVETLTSMLENRRSTVQRRLQQGVQGKTDIPVSPVTGPAKPAGEKSDVDRLLDELEKKVRGGG